MVKVSDLNKEGVIVHTHDIFTNHKITWLKCGKFFSKSYKRFTPLPTKPTLDGEIYAYTVYLERRRPCLGTKEKFLVDIKSDCNVWAEVSALANDINKGEWTGHVPEATKSSAVALAILQDQKDSLLVKQIEAALRVGENKRRVTFHEADAALRVGKTKRRVTFHEADDIPLD